MVVRKKHGVGNILQNHAMHAFGVAKCLPLPLTFVERAS
jgi:hypothetical protein